MRLIPLEDAPETRGRVEQWGVLPEVAEQVLTTGMVMEIVCEEGRTPLRAKQAADAYKRRHLKKGVYPVLAHIRTSRTSAVPDKIFVEPRDKALARQVRDAIHKGQDRKAAELLRAVFPDGLPVARIKPVE
jgi:hypothetical protein